MQHHPPDSAAPSEEASPPPVCRLLLIEDDPDTAALMRECIEDHFGQSTVEVVSSLAKAREKAIESYDLVISDMHLPDGLGLDLLGEMLERSPSLPVVFVTAESATDRAIEAICAGAYDYIVKAGDYLFAMPVVIEKNLAQAHTQAENKRLLEELRQKNHQLEDAVEQLRHVASTDPLTGLANRRAFANEFEARFAERVRDGQDLALIMMDLDGFKKLNDTVGHPAGDQVLGKLADALLAHCRISDHAGRFGGDEFILLLNQADEAEARQIAQRIDEQFQQAARQTCGELNYQGQVSVSMGLTTLLGGHAFTPEQMLTQADQSMYRAKETLKHTEQTEAKRTGVDCLQIYRPDIHRRVSA